jgi:hypothetical protein
MESASVGKRLIKPPLESKVKAFPEIHGFQYHCLASDVLASMLKPRSSFEYSIVTEHSNSITQSIELALLTLKQQNRETTTNLTQSRNKSYI